jgi:hypothetical protein
MSAKCSHFSLLPLSFCRVYYNASVVNSPYPIGLNIALGDVDAQSVGDPTYGLRHEMWWNGTKGGHTFLSQYGTLVLEPGNKPSDTARG